MRVLSWSALVLLSSTLLLGCNSAAVRDGEAGTVELAVSRQESTSADRQRAKVHTELGRLYLQDNRFDVALGEARIALESDSGYAPAYNLRGLVYMALRKDDLAEDGFRQAISLAPNDPEINNDYGYFLCRSGRPRDSIRHFRLAFNNRLYETPAKALTNAGYCSILSGENRQGEEYLLRALQIDRTNVAAHYWLAELAYREQRLSDARQRLNQLHAQIEPTAESAWLALRVDRKLGDREGEAHNMGTLRRKYRDSPEYQKLMRGEYD